MTTSVPGLEEKELVEGVIVCVMVMVVARDGVVSRCSLQVLFSE